MAGRNIKITDQGAVIFSEDEAGAKTVSLKAPSNVTENYTTAFPAAAAPGTTLMNATRSGGSEPYDVSLSFQPAANVGMAGVNVLNHSVTGTAVAEATGDDTANIKAAVDVAETAGANSLSERLVFPAGGYRLKELGKAGGATACFTYDKNYWFEGAGMGITNMFCAMDGAGTSGTHSMIECTDTEPNFFALTDMTFDGNAGGSDSEDLAAINISANYIVIDNVEFKNFTDPVIRIVGSPDFVSITNCKFTDMVANTGSSYQAQVCLDGITSDECTFIFDGNRVVGTPDPAQSGVSVNGVQVRPSASSKKVRCVIKNNHFKELGNAASEPPAAVTLDPGCHDSVISDNVFESCVHSSIRVESCNNIEISGNTLAGESSEMDASHTIYGITVESHAESTAGARIINNTIVGTDKTDIGIVVDGDDAEVNSIDGVVIAGNIIDGCEHALSIDNVKGKVDITGNDIKNSYSGNNQFPSADSAQQHRHAVDIDDLTGAAQVNISKNTFTGSANSGGAIHFNRDLATQTDSEVHVTLKDNFFDRMGQHADWEGAIAEDLALVYINGKATTDRIKTFHASGNKYDFTSAQAGTYGLFVEDISESVTFDSVLEFGAIGDGATDRTMAINRAGLAAGAGGDIHIPPGTFLVSDRGEALADSTDYDSGSLGVCIEISADDQLWRGRGTILDGSTDVGGGSNDIVFSVGDKTGITVSGLKFTGSHVTANTGIAINADGGASNLTIEKCSINQFQKGINAGSDDSRVSGCYISNTAATGAAITLHNECSGAVITGNSIVSDSAAGTDKGIAVVGAKNVNVNGNSVKNTGSNAIDVSASASEVSIQGNTINMSDEDIDGNAISADTCTGITISGNTVVGGGEYAPARQDIELNAVTYGSVSNNTLTSKQVKIEASGASSFIPIVGNSLRNNDETPKDAANPIILGAASSACSVNGNTIVQEGTPSSASKGLSLQGDDNVVTSNVFKGFHTGIDIIAGAERNIVGFNRYMTGITTAVADAGTDSTIQKTETAGTSTFDNLHVDILRFGTHGADIAVGETNIINITNGFHYFNPATTADVEVDCITIAGNHTRKDVGGTDVSAAQALACAPYDGMILLLAKGNTNASNTVEFRWDTTGKAHPADSPSGGSAFLGASGGSNLRGGAGADSGGGAADALATEYSDSVMFRFEFSTSAGEGYWRIISDAFTA